MYFGCIRFFFFFGLIRFSVMRENQLHFVVDVLVRLSFYRYILIIEKCIYFIFYLIRHSRYGTEMKNVTSPTRDVKEQQLTRC